MADFDLIIIGGGPAGLTAGLYAARANMSTVLFEGKDTGGEILNTDLIEDWPGEESITGRELADKMAAHARKFGLDIRTYAAVKAVRTDGDRKVVVLEDGSEHRAYAVIVAVGGEPVKLGVPGEQEFAGRGVSYCAVCDGAFFKGADLAVVGGGDSAFQEGLFLTRYAKRLYLVHRRTEYKAQAILQERLLGMDKVEAVTPAQVTRIGGESDVRWIDVERGGKPERLAVEGVFIFIGFKPLGRALFEEHVDHDENGYLVTDQFMQTSIPGVYAVGDTRAQLAKQVTTAVGDATTAVIHAERYVEELKHAEKAFPRADERVLAEATRNVRTRRYAAGATVLRAGDPATEMYVVLEGELTVHRDGREVDVIRKGDYFGELGLLSPDHRRTATVVARTGAELMILDRGSFERIVRSSRGAEEDVTARAEERRGAKEPARTR